MDIADRLKIYIDHLNIASSQFADAALIPRPTLSQLLNGRNKKVSNELIAKIHDAYPSLNVMWLLFGDGDMEYGENNQISGAKKGCLPVDSDSLFSDYKEITGTIVSTESNTEKYSNNFSCSGCDDLDSKKTNPQRKLRSHDINIDGLLTNQTSGSDNSRTVQSIMIFYSDNSFETFVPANRQ